MTTPKENLVGKKFGKLIVIKQAEDKVEFGNVHRTMWLCDCECGNKNILALDKNLKKGIKRSCGCLRKHKNTYDLSGEYGIGYTSNNKEFYFDLEDYDLIKDICWHIRSNGYVVNKTGDTTIHMHRLIMGIQGTNKDVYVDHIVNNNKNDNRKCNLRLVNASQNMQNSKIRSNNNSGYTGVDYVKASNKWRSRIHFNNIEYNLGTFDNYEDAVMARKEAEIKYFGDYRYSKNNKEEEDSREFITNEN